MLRVAVVAVVAVVVAATSRDGGVAAFGVLPGVQSGPRRRRSSFPPPRTRSRQRANVVTAGAATATRAGKRLPPARMPRFDPSGEQPQRLETLDGMTALVLNANYEPLSFLPLSVWSWQEAVKAVFQERVDVVATYDVQVRSATYSCRLPAVVVLKKYERKTFKPPRFSKRLLLLRDNYSCQYCDVKGDLTCDHVTPRSKGGRTEWSNVVAACRTCNAKKKNIGPRDLKSVGMALASQPRAPTPYQLEAIARRRCLQVLQRRPIPDTWKTYLYHSESYYVS